MIGPVSGTGRAMMASLQQAIQKGMPPDQAVQYVKSMATQGIAPMTDLYAMMNQFQRLKQQQVQPPQTPPTIKDQLNILDQQQQMQAQQGGIAGMQAPAPQGNPMDRGLGAIDAGRMEYPQFAGGGMVALAAGGDIDEDVVRMANGTPRSFFENLGEAFGAQSYAAPVNPMGREISIAGIPLEQIAPAYEKALIEGDQERINALSAALNRTEQGRSIESGLRTKVLQQKRAAEAAERKAGALSFVRDETKAPPAPPRTDTGGAGRGGAGAGVSLGGNYDDFGKYRTEAGKLRTQAEQEANLTAMERAQQIEKDLAAMGIGKAAEERTKFLDRREAEAGKQLAEDRRMALAQAGFAMAEAASRRGRDRTGFLGAAAIGGTKGAQLIDKAVRENRALKDSIAENRLSLMQAQEMMKAGNYREGAAQAREAKQNLASLSQALATNELGISKFVGEQKGADRRTGAQIAAEREYREALTGLKREELGIKKMAEIAMIPDKEQREKALQEVLKSLAGGEEAMTGVEDLLAKYGR